MVKKFVAPITDSVIDKNQLKLDTEISELVESADEMSVSEFFSVYDSIKNTIPGGTGNLLFSYKSVIEEVQRLTATNTPNDAGLNVVLNEQRLSFANNWLNPTQKTHSELFTYSISQLKNLDESILASYVVMGNVFHTSHSLQTQVNETEQNITRLKQTNADLQVIIENVGRTRGSDFGYQIVSNIVELNVNEKDASTPLVNWTKRVSTVILYNAKRPIIKYQNSISPSGVYSKSRGGAVLFPFSFEINQPEPAVLDEFKRTYGDSATHIVLVRIQNDRDPGYPLPVPGLHYVTIEEQDAPLATELLVINATKE
jgi:hypothetical protein